MHGRLKIRTTEEQKIQKQKEQQKKLVRYKEGLKVILASRKTDSYDATASTTCAQILMCNPDVYTLWNYRKEVILIEIKKSKEDEKRTLVTFLENEIKLTEQCLLANPKSYGAWHHRYWTLEHHPKPNWQKEFDLCNQYLKMDDRNFHCWDYRRLIINNVGVTLPEELKFSTERIEVNFSNYSSWHYRSSLRKLDQNSLESELILVQNAVFTDPADSSAWFYLRWVLSNTQTNKEHIQKMLDAFDQLLELEQDCKWIFMAKCWLTGSLCLNDKNFIDDRMQLYKKLEELDPLRKGQYQDYLKIAEEKSVGD